MMKTKLIGYWVTTGILAFGLLAGGAAYLLRPPAIVAGMADLGYHPVSPAKYRRVVFADAVDRVLREVCLKIGLRYEIEFIEIGTDGDHVHFLLQGIPFYSPTMLLLSDVNVGSG